MDERLHKKYNECDEGNYIIVITIKTVFIFYLYIILRISSQGHHPRDIIPGMMRISIILKYEIGVAGDDAKRLGSVCAFNRVGFIIVPIYVLKTEVVVMCIIV